MNSIIVCRASTSDNQDPNQDFQWYRALFEIELSKKGSDTHQYFHFLLEDLSECPRKEDTFILRGEISSSLQGKCWVSPSNLHKLISLLRKREAAGEWWVTKGWRTAVLETIARQPNFHGLLII